MLGLFEIVMEFSKVYEFLFKYGVKSVYDYIDKRGRDKSNTFVYCSDLVLVELVDLICLMLLNGVYYLLKFDRLMLILK